MSGVENDEQMSFVSKNSNLPQAECGFKSNLRFSEVMSTQYNIHRSQLSVIVNMLRQLLVGCLDHHKGDVRAGAGLRGVGFAGMLTNTLYEQCRRDYRRVNLSLLSFHRQPGEASFMVALRDAFYQSLQAAWASVYTRIRCDPEFKQHVKIFTSSKFSDGRYVGLQLFVVARKRV